jgi:hypothetical protein
MKKPSLKGHALCRPPRGAAPVHSVFKNTTKLWRLGIDGKWRADDGTPGLAFIGRNLGDVIVWSAECKCPYLLGCAAGAGADYAFDKLDLAVFSHHRRRPVYKK